jgi:hypothetical protein
MEVIEQARIDNLNVCLHMYKYIGMYCIYIYIYTLYTYISLVVLFLLTTPAHDAAHNCVRIK